jgi:hypothetical protein
MRRATKRQVTVAARNLRQQWRSSRFATEDEYVMYFYETWFADCQRTRDELYTCALDNHFRRDFLVIIGGPYARKKGH